MNRRFFYEPSVKELIDSFSTAFNVKITFYSPSFEEWLVGFSTQSSDYCTFLQNKLKLRGKCFEQDRTMCKACEKKKEILVYTCHTGLSEAVIPITIDGELMFYAMLGQFRTTAIPSAKILALWEKTGENREVLEKAFLAQPYYTPSKKEGMLNLFKKTLSILLEKNLVKMTSSSLVEGVIDYVERNIDKPITLTEVATYIGKSSSAITHAVKKKTGFSFKELVIFKKISAFERILSSDHQLSIIEASSMVGYYDSLYFSRLYKKYRHIPPSKYLEQKS
ncbi:MAG: helix-turn-helix domain-containing protein [Spirochaetales bacterium]|nr:helix-turn-helix domain-containing protein [Spirochaetales bacterium]